MSQVPKVQEVLESKQFSSCATLQHSVQLTKAFWSSLHLNPEEAHHFVVRISIGGQFVHLHSGFTRCK